MANTYCLNPLHLGPSFGAPLLNERTRHKPQQHPPYILYKVRTVEGVTPLKMPFELRKATIHDIPELVRVYHVSLACDKVVNACYGAVSPAVLEAMDIQTFTNLFGLRWVHFFKVIDTSTGRIAGWSEWEFPHTSDEARVAKEVIIAKREEEGPFDIEGINYELCCELAMQSKSAQEEWCDHEIDFNLKALVVSPDYRRLGLGTTLVQVGLGAADEAGARTHVEATPMGLPVYLKLGFETVAELVVDLAEFGGDGMVTDLSLVRKPVCRSFWTYRRPGLGSLHVEFGLGAADAVEAKTYGEATPMGLPAYAKLGSQMGNRRPTGMRKT